MFLLCLPDLGSGLSKRLRRESQGAKNRFRTEMRATTPKETKEFPISMKRSLALVCMLASGLGATAMAQAGAPSSAPAAAPAGPAKIAVIMFQPAVMQTNEGQRNFADLQKKYEPKRVQLKSQSDEIEALRKQLQTGGATLSDAERANRTKSLDDKEKSFQRLGEDTQNDFQQDLQQTYTQLAEKVFGVLQTYAQQNGYTLVIDGSTQQSPVLWASQGTDISAAVIEAYNQKSGVPAPPPSAPGAAAPSAPTPRTTPRPSGAAPR